MCSKIRRNLISASVLYAVEMSSSSMSEYKTFQSRSFRNERSPHNAWHDDSEGMKSDDGKTLLSLNKEEDDTRLGVVSLLRCGCSGDGGLAIRSRNSSQLDDGSLVNAGILMMWHLYQLYYRRRVGFI